MPGRNYSAASEYRYGFNGQEHSDDVTQGNYTAEYWEYDGRIGRRWNVDPVVKIWESPYACFNNNPIANSDIHGDDADGPVDPSGNPLVLPNNATVNSTSLNANDGTVDGSDNVTALSVAGSVNSFTIGNKSFEARFNSKGEFTRYATATGETYNVTDYFDVEEHTMSGWSRVFAGIKGIGGLFEAGGGALLGGATSWSGGGLIIGGAIFLHGADVASANLTAMFTGNTVKTFTQKAMIAGGVSEEAAAYADDLFSAAGGGYSTGISLMSKPMLAPPIMPAAEVGGIADDAFVHVTTPGGAANILSKGLDPEISGFVTKWKYVKNVSNGSDFNTMLYSQKLWSQTAGKFDNGFNILHINAKPSFFSPRTNWVNGVPQYKFNSIVDPSLINKIK